VISYLLISVAALLAALLTFFTGFGLGTLLLPAFALFFPVAVAIGITAVVHLANNVFKLALVARHVCWPTVFWFGFPAALAALAGARLLVLVSALPPICSYAIGAHQLSVVPIKLLVATLMASFAFIELSDLSRHICLDSKYMAAGGLVSGFFGGLSGHQGAFRSIFLLKAGFSKEAFVATSSAVALLIDLSRLTVYVPQLLQAEIAQRAGLLAAATSAALAGSVLGSQLMRKVTFRFIEIAASLLLLLVAFALASGLI